MRYITVESLKKIVEEKEDRLEYYTKMFLYGVSQEDTLITDEYLDKAAALHHELDILEFKLKGLINT